MDEKVNETEFPNRAVFFKVYYQENHSKTFNPLKDESQVFFNFFNTKSKVWEYENEYRSHILYDIYKKQEFKFNKKILSEVIFGVQTPEDDKRLITDIVTKHYIQNGIDVKLYKTEKVKGKIEIGFKRIN